MMSDSNLPPPPTAATTAASSSSMLPSLLALAMTIAALAAVATSALFTATDTEGSNSFSTGSVDIAATPEGTEIVLATDMAPGDVETGQVAVTNGGTIESRYSVTSTTGEDILAAQLDMTIWDESTEASTDDGCDATAPTDPTPIYGPAVLGTSTGTNVIGDPTQGSQAGDRILAAAGTDVLCFRVELPSSTGNSFESKTTDATFEFIAEQTANNA